MREQVKKWLQDALTELRINAPLEDYTDLRDLMGELCLLSILAAAEYELRAEGLVRMENSIRTVSDFVDIICLKKSTVPLELTTDELHLLIEMATDYRQKGLKQLEAGQAFEKRIPEINQHTKEKLNRALVLTEKLHQAKK